jgi:hypothetical protein
VSLINPFDNPQDELEFLRGLFKKLFNDEGNYSKMLASLKQGRQDFKLLVVPEQKGDAAEIDMQPKLPQNVQVGDLSQPHPKQNYLHRMKLREKYRRPPKDGQE